MIPMFAPNVGATVTSLGNGGLGTYNEQGYDSSTWAKVFDRNDATNAGSGYTTSYKTATGHLTNSITTNYPISSVAVTLFCRKLIGSSSVGDAQQKIYTHSTLYTGNTFAVDADVTNTKTWNTNPYTSAAWTWDEVDALEAGFAMKVDTAEELIGCAEMWVNVTHTPTITPVTSSISSVTETNATFSGTTTYGSTDMTCGFWYNTTGVNTNVTSTGTYDYGEAFTKTVTDLIPGYYYNVTAWSLKSGVGMFYSSTVLHFLAKPYPPSNCSSIISENNITVSWTNFTKAASTTRYTMVRYSNTAYPTTTSTGTLLINTSSVNTSSINWYNPGITYYFSYWTYISQASCNAWSTTYNTSVVTTPTKPDNLAATTFNDTRIGLSWDKGTGDTVIVRNTTGYPATPSNGTEIYNGSLEICTDTGLNPSTLYYYRAWNWNGTSFSPGYTNTSQYTRPNKPYNLGYAVVGGDLNITWARNSTSDRTVIRKSTSSQPLTPTSGTLLYNNTGLYNVDTSLTSSNYYTLFSYNSTTNLYSEYTPLSWYAVWLSCYNESSGDAITNFQVFFTNPSGSSTYEATGCSNPYSVNSSLIPQGDDITILVNASGYYSRTYTRDISVTSNYFFDAYLVPITATLYYLRVMETIETEYTKVDQGVEDVTVTVKRYINATVGYQPVTSLVTDANGYVNLQLVPYIQYKVFLNKTGYEDKISDYIPAPPNEWGQTVEKVFKIEKISTIPVVPTVYLFWDEIVFTGTMNTNNTLYVVYDDSLLGTVDSQVYVYEFYNGSLTLVNSTSWAGLDSYSFYVMGINTSRLHYVDLYLNHSMSFGEGFNLQPVRIIILPINLSINRTKFDLEARIEALFGPGPMGSGSWCPFIVCMIGLCTLSLFGPFHVGPGIIITGFVMALLSVIFGIWLTNPFPVAVTGIIGFIVAIGVLYMLAKQPSEQL